MKFTRLEINNFLGIGHMEIEFDFNGLVLITGENRDSPVSTSNGASKSSIPEAILWCLYGTTKRGLKGDDVVNRTVGRDCSVQVWFDSYRVERTRASDSGNSLRVYDGDLEITKGTSQATQELIETIIGRGRLAFEKLFHFGQGDTQPLASMTDANLKTIFEESFNLGFIKDCFLKIKAEEKIMEGELAKIKSELEMIGREISTIDMAIAQLVDVHRKFTAQKETEIAKFRDDIAALEKEQIEFEKAQKAYGKGFLKSTLEFTRRKIAEEVAFAKKELQDMNDQLAKANAEYQVALRDGKAYRDSLVKLYEDKKKAESKVGTPCPSCKKTINKEDVSGVVQSYDEKIQEEVSKIEHYRDLMADADRKLQSQKELLNRATDSLNRAMEEEANHAIIWQKFMECEELSAKIKAIEVHKQSLQDRIDSLSKEENPMPEKIKAATKESKDKRLKKKKLDKDAKQKDYDLSLVSTLAEIFGNAGLKSYIFDSITPRLNELINQYLRRLDNMSVEFSTQKQLKSGDLREKFDITIQTEHGPSSFDALSGGEKQRVSLAISLAMNKLMREIAGDPLNILFLDEVAEALDESSAEAVFGLISDFAGDVDNIFVISHNQALKDIIPTVLTVIKEGGVSRIANPRS